MKKIYCYVDESGQDTKGDLFVVSVVLTQKERDEFQKQLEKLEKNSGKGKLKWSRAKLEAKLTYLNLVLSFFKNKKGLLFSVFRDTTDYDLATIMSISKAIYFGKPKERYKALIYVDALSKTKRMRYGSELRKLGIHTGKVQGVTKEANNPMIRLADSIAGWTRDVLEGEKGEVKKLFDKAIKNKTLVQV